MVDQKKLDIVRSLKIKYFWIFVTERCNLKCNYCFYKFRGGENKIDFNNLKILLDFFPNLHKSEFVISGGEPLLEWSLVCKIINYLKSKFNNYIVIQTNGILLDKNKIKFLKEKDVGLEFGIDGKLLTMSKNRIGIDRYFNRIIDNIYFAKRNKLKLSSTMTVYPEQTLEMSRNYKYIISLGIDKVEITPAAFERWDNKNIFFFKKEYKKIINYALTTNQLNTISIEYDKPLGNMTIDIIPLPDNNVMTNWALLSLPKRLKSRYALLKIDNNKILINQSFIDSHFKRYCELFTNENVTYRDYSNLNVKWVYKKLFNNINSYFDNYKLLGDFLKKINQKIILIKKYDKIRKQ